MRFGPCTRRERGGASGDGGESENESEGVRGGRTGRPRLASPGQERGEGVRDL